MKYLILCLVVLVLTGCATTGYITGGRNEIGYEKFHDSYGDQKIVSRNNDLYLEKLDGSESRRLTNTPKTLEGVAFFADNGKYIVYSQGTDPKWVAKGTGPHYIIKKEDNDQSRKEISDEEIVHLWEINKKGR